MNLQLTSRCHNLGPTARENKRKNGVLNNESVFLEKKKPRTQRDREGLQDKLNLVLTRALWPAISWSSSVWTLVLLLTSKSSVSKSESSSSSGVCHRDRNHKSNTTLGLQLPQASGPTAWCIDIQNFLQYFKQSWGIKSKSLNICLRPCFSSCTCRAARSTNSKQRHHTSTSHRTQVLYGYKGFSFYQWVDTLCLTKVFTS